MPEFASAGLTVQQIDAIIKKLGGQERALSFLRDELPVSSRSWHERDGVIYFSVTSDGTTGEDWLKRLPSLYISASAMRVLRSPCFKPTSGVTTEVAVLRARSLRMTTGSLQ